MCFSVVVVLLVCLFCWFVCGLFWIGICGWGSCACCLCVCLVGVVLVIYCLVWCLVWFD